MKSRNISKRKSREQVIAIKTGTDITLYITENGLLPVFSETKPALGQKNLKMAKLKNPNVFENTCFQKSFQTYDLNKKHGN